MQQKGKLIVFDTSLRDGEQSPGVTLNVEEKVAIAKQLSRLGVDVIEAGFPIASPGDFLAVEKIAQEVGSLMEGREAIGKPVVVCGLARAVQKDIQTAYDAIKSAKCHRIHTFLATSDIHLEHKLKISREKCLERAVEAVSFAKSLCEDIEFSPEDAGRSDPDFLVKILSAVIKAGATTLNIPDTVGYKTPTEFGGLIKYLVDNTVGAKDVVWSVHCHNDLGLATANTLAGISNGSRQVEVTINGIGERAGNTALEEVVMNIFTHPNTYPVYHTINTRLFASTSRLISDMTGMLVQPNKAIVGKNAFLHESGIHQDGVLKNKETYEIIKPEDVGVFTSNILLGKHSGRHAIQSRLEELGYSPFSFTEAQKDAVFARFKTVADSKKTSVTDDDLNAIASSILSSSFETPSNPSEPAQNSSEAHEGAPLSSSFNQAPDFSTISKTSGTKFYELSKLQVLGGLGTASSATVSLKVLPTGEVLTETAQARSGPVESIFSAIKKIIPLDISLISYNLSATSKGSDSVGKATIRIRENSAVPSETNDLPTFAGTGIDTDVLTASAFAYISAANRLILHNDSSSASRSSLKDRSAPV
ncbi:2-isopropylmalate synthase [Smittium mucronatum]|uniref:2-isopropylmalate synthase n=1 Tax=Smittium mucronatum TaxID=133383 RepID=A0A1R0H8A2_9FUNG|nr:2-isopropylmalate synthase [Smittium mucronatum]